MPDKQSYEVIRAVLKPGVPPDCSELVASEIITELRRAGFLIVPAAPHPDPVEHVSSMLLREAAEDYYQSPAYLAYQAAANGYPLAARPVDPARPAPNPCYACDGEGIVRSADPEDDGTECPVCDGYGIIHREGRRG